MKKITWGRWLLGIMFIAAGANHFLNPAFYEPMVPPYVGLTPHLAVLISGIFEILGGLGVLIERSRRFSAWGLIALLVAVFPANLHMAMYPELFDVAAVAAYSRLPLQGLMIYWAWRYTRAYGQSPV
jgi:uncharacterized membrane protein